MHGDIDTKLTTNLVNIPVEYIRSKDTSPVTIKKPCEHSPDQGKKTAREGGGSMWRRLERTQQSHTTTNPKDSDSCGSKRRVLYDEAETERTNPRGK